jgi:hypothetical protein
MIAYGDETGKALAGELRRDNAREPAARAQGAVALLPVAHADLLSCQDSAWEILYRRLPPTNLEGQHFVGFFAPGGRHLARREAGCGNAITRTGFKEVAGEGFEPSKA